MLHELVYTSRAGASITRDRLEEILAVSRTNNDRNNITGLLVFDGSTFCQILEGEKSAIDKTYDRIKQDNRHIDSFVLHTGEIHQRNFQNWSMSFKMIQKRVNTESWTDILTARKMISDIPSDKTLGSLILKLLTGKDSFDDDTPFGVV
jgi:hypothetical protein